MDADIVKDLNDVTLENLRSLASDISLESLALPGNVFGSQKKLTAFFSNARRFMSKFAFNPLNVAQFSTGDISDLLSRVSQVGYVDAANKDVTVPEGFVGKWVPYTEELRSAIQKAVTLSGEVLAFNQTLGRIINDPSLLTGVSGIGHAGDGSVGLDAQLNAIGKAFFDGKTHHISRPLGTLVERSSDIQLAHKTINSVISAEKSISPQSILKSIDRTLELGDVVTGLIADEGKASKAAAKEIVGITLNLAQEIEAYGVLLFRIRQFHLSLKDAMKDMRK